jgi:hypothetical protein
MQVLHRFEQFDDSFYRSVNGLSDRLGRRRHAARRGQKYRRNFIVGMSHPAADQRGQIIGKLECGGSYVVCRCHGQFNREKWVARGEFMDSRDSRAGQ